MNVCYFEMNYERGRYFEMLHIGSDRSLFHDLREDSKNIRALHEIVKYKLCPKGCKLLFERMLATGAFKMDLECNIRQ